MARKNIHHFDFPTLVMVNKEVVALTGERHEYGEEDAGRLRGLVKEVEGTANDDEFDEAIIQKTSLLIKGIVESNGKFLVYLASERRD